MGESIKKQLLFVACINIGQIIVGYSMGWSAPIIPKLQDPEITPLPEAATDVQTSWVGSLVYVGAVIGPFITGALANLVGRRPCLVIGALLNVVGYILVISTNNIAMIFALRIITGLGIGITTVCNIVYIGEIASTHIRGMLLTSTQIVGITGTLLVYSIGPYVSYVATGYVALGICALHLTVLILVIPESPVYYAIKGHENKAVQTLNILGRSEDAMILFKGTQNEGESRGNFKDFEEIVTVKCNRKSFIITFMLGSFQQFSGVTVVLFFSTTIFQLAGSSIEPNLATIIIGATRLVASLIAPIFVDRQGRKILLLISMASCAISLSVLGFYFYLDKINHAALGSIGWLPLVSLVVYFLSYESGFGSIPNAIVGEMFTANVRANGSTLAITLTWVVGFAIATSFNSMLGAVGGDVTFLIFGGSCVLAFVFTLFCVPETKGKTLHEIQEMLS